jgi:hypothetical protein
MDVGGKTPLRVVLQQLGVCRQQTSNLEAARRAHGLGCVRRELDRIHELRETSPDRAVLRRGSDVFPDTAQLERARRQRPRADVGPALE